MIGMSNQNAQAGSSGASVSKTGRSPTKFTPMKNTPPKGSLFINSKKSEPACPQMSCSLSPGKGKGKAKQTSVEPSDDGETASK
ncbi:hypothetical protein PTTG_30766 [Puccinia triticina 1-1 BBBD Race 1]|uniref:Uncharacterized protein n=1 Tax=Puccinia triticina (isolate 1-1 / race 1 (BBBD)) TaxID=630390 RepID=A0A180FXW7_PUCT1|nr:hypothetical protein PTTG_30766 [Puccinia triticina 1-1 BBBD Race 1]WAR53427.1 hypothetical protein PtB15_2B858 [Puccinia triticina]